MSKEKGFLAYYNLLLMIVILASLTTITIRNVSVQYLYNAYFSDCYCRSLIENIGHRLLEELNDKKPKRSTYHEYFFNANAYIGGGCNLIDKNSNKYCISILLNQAVLYKRGYGLLIYCSVVDDKIVIEEWRGKHG